MNSTKQINKETSIKSPAVCRMFSEIAPRYDLLNTVISLSFHKRWRKHAVALALLNSGDNAIDLCCGTGDFTFDLLREVGENGEVIGVDFCEPMLDIARSKALKCGLKNVVFQNANVLQLPFADCVFQCATIGFGLRNIANTFDALSEIYRVLVPSGKIVCLEASKVNSRLVKPFWWLYFYKITPILASLFGGKTGAYKYLPASVHTFYSRHELTQVLEDVGFVNVWHKDLMFGAVCIHIAEKQK